MSGGSMGYAYSQIEEYAEMLEDPELVDIAKDFAKLYHDAEWYHSSDTSKGNYRETVKWFKGKWLNNKQYERTKVYIDAELDALRDKLYEMLGMPKLCEDCKHHKPCDKYDGKYVMCDIHTGCLWHHMDCCEDWDK